MQTSLFYLQNIHSHKIYHVIFNMKFYGISSEKYKNIDDFTFLGNKSLHCH